MLASILKGETNAERRAWSFSIRADPFYMPQKRQPVAER